MRLQVQKLTKFSGIYCFDSKKRFSPLDCTHYRIYWELQAIAVAQLMFIVHNWFIYTSDSFSRLIFLVARTRPRREW